MNMTRGWQLFVVAALAAGCGDNRGGATADAGGDGGGGQTPEERGGYIMNVLAACTFCHTPLLPNGMRDNDKLLSGVDCFVDFDSPTFLDNGNGTGCLSTRNLTPHATGLKNATDQQIKDAFRNGIRTDGKKLAPVMPYWIFHNMTDEDADAIVAYLRSIPPVDHQVKANEPGPAVDYNDGVIPPLPFIQPEEIPIPRGGANNQSAMRGRYLSSMAGLCIDCHTPTVNPANPFELQLDMTMAYGGGKVFPAAALGLIDPSAYPVFIATRNLTPDATGLMGWSKDQIKNSIAIGKDRDGNGVCAATHGGAISPYAALEPQDLDDIVEYVANLPAVAYDTAVLPCGLPAVGTAESGTACEDGLDNDTDGVANDGCLCGDCAGPPVP
jgi:mono/diheme cytochrome c family protein